MSGREKGVATSPCGNCGRDLNLVAMPDGGSSTEACPTCYGPAAEPEKASKRTSRERGTTISDEGDL